jgi:peptidylprolyl isomerase
VNNFRDATYPLRARALAAFAMLAVGHLIAGCGGSSGESSTITIGNENKADSKLVSASANLIPKTPATGPHSEEPKIAVGKGAPPTELVKKDLVVGTGAEAKKGSTVYVNYVGANYKTGKIFDASWKRKEPFLFVIGTGEVIEGWDQGVVGMKVGGRRELVIPSKLGYGAKGNLNIPKNEALIFVVDLLKA